MNRFCRIEQLLGPAALRKLKAARVAVFGLGAVGKEEPDTFVKGRPRRPIGSLSYMTGMFGLLAAHQALRLIVDLDDKRDA